jgi:putative DNA primase/helicase
MCARWVADNQVALSVADPKIPGALHDRAADNWRCLLAIADLAGADWPEKARQVAVLLSGDPDESSSAGTQLLEDLRDLFVEDGGDALFTETILAALAEMTDRPWPEWKNAKPMSSRQLAKLLGLYRVKSKTVWRDGKSAKGYDLTDLQEHFDRYLTSQSVNPSEPQESAGYSANQSVREQPALTDSKPPKPAENSHSDGLTDSDSDSVVEAAAALNGKEENSDGARDEREAIMNIDGKFDPVRDRPAFLDRSGDT